MNKPDYLKKACEHYLSSWDETKYTTGKKLVTALEDSVSDVPEDILVWEPFETYPPDEIASMIIHLSVNYKAMFGAGMEYELLSRMRKG
jgi:hypothetical protein